MINESNLKQYIVSPQMWKEGAFKAIEGVTPLDFPKDNYLSFANGKKNLVKFLENLHQESMTLLLPKELEEVASDLINDKASPLQVIFTENLNLSICQISQFYYEKFKDELKNRVDGRQVGNAEIHPGALISQNVFIGEGVKIADKVNLLPGVVVMSDVHIEEGTTIYPNVTIYPRVKIGKNCRIHSSTVIGADGFGYNFHAGVHHKIWHYGGVQIGDHVEIGAMSCVDSGTFSPTIIESGTKIDNQVQIGHNVRIKQGSVLCGQVGVGGSAEIGQFSVLGGKAGVGDNVKVGDQAQVAGSAMVNTSWPEKSVLAGHPARPLKEWLKGVAYVRKESLKGSK